MSKIFIHVGAHKTASSFIQANLRANRDVFERQGWRMIDFQEDFKKARRQVVLVRRTKRLKAQGRAKLDAFFAEVRDDPRNIFLTYEGFLGSMSMANGAIYPHHEVTIQMLKENLAGRGRDVVVGFCVRNFADQAESSYNFRAAGGQSKMSFRAYAKNISPESVSWLSIIEHLSDAFGRENLILWTFEDFKMDGVAAFLEIVRAAGVDTGEIAMAMTTPKNVSATPEQMQLLRDWYQAIRTNLKIPKSSAIALQRKLRRLIAELPREPKEKNGHFSKGRRRKLTRHYERELAVIREKWGDRMLDFGVTLPPEEVPDPQENTQPVMTA